MLWRRRSANSGRIRPQRMAIAYQKAVNVKGTGPSGEDGDKIESEHYNKLAKAFNDRLVYGVGDTTWRLFFSAHSMMRSMVRIKPGFNSENVWQEPTQEDAWWKIYSHIIPSPLLYEPTFSKNYRNSDNPFSQSDASSMSGTVYSWPTGKIGRFKGPETKNPLVAYIYGTAGGTVDWFYNEKKLPPEWFRAQLVRLELDLSAGTDLDLKNGAKEWKDKAISGDGILNNGEDTEPVPLVDSFMWYDSKTNPSNEKPFWAIGSSSPSTLAQMWLLAKVQRGVVVPNINDPDVNLYQYKSSMTHAAAPAYMTARWYYDYYIHWRSPYGKTPPAYEPSPEIIALCPWRDRRFPPIPRYEYKFSPINPDTHKVLKFKTGCPGGISSSDLVYAVRREYDHYNVIFWDGKYKDLVTGKRRKGNLKLPYKHYFEGPYDGGGRLTKRESEKDLMDAALNFYNSSFRKHFSANMSKEIFSKYLVEAERGPTGAEADARYVNLSEATFDVPTWGFEFQDFFEKQYSLAPAIGKVNWKDSWKREGDEAEYLYEPEYPTFAFLANGTDGTNNTVLEGDSELDVYKSVSRPDIDAAETFSVPDSYGTEHYGLFTTKILSTGHAADRFFPSKNIHPKAGDHTHDEEDEPIGGSRGDSIDWKNYCIAGYYIVGAGIRVTIDENGDQNPASVTFDLKEYKNSNNYDVVTTHQISAGVNIVPSSGFCVEINEDKNAPEYGDTSTKPSYETRETCTAANFTWIAEGVFEKMHYFAKSKDVTLSNRRVKLSSSSELVFLDEPEEDGGVWGRDMGGGTVLAGNSWCGIAMEMAVLLRMRPDLPDAMLMLRLASTGFGSTRERVDLRERIGKEADLSKGISSTGFRLDTKGDMLPTTFNPDGTPDITKAPQMIWRNYDNYGIIKNLFNRNNLPHRTTEGHERTDSESYTKTSMDENIAAGGEAGKVGNSDLPISFNPIYDSAREMYHRHLRMVPRTRLEDYQVIRDHSDARCISYNDDGGYEEHPEIKTEQECKDAFSDDSWIGVKDKSELTFIRYVDTYGDPDIPDMGGVHEETLHEKVYNPIVVEPEKPGGPSG